MAKGKKLPLAVQKGAGGGSKKGGSSKANPFETLSLKRKFPVLGQKTKGVKKNIVKASCASLLTRGCGGLQSRRCVYPMGLCLTPQCPACPFGAAPQVRSEAVERRKKSLLVEYKNLGKSNAFLDKRFGEKDANLDEEEKALMRFQKQRLKQLKSSKFSLSEPAAQEGDDGDEEGLTHLGMALADIDDLGIKGYDSEDLEEIDADLTARLNFGGGEAAAEDGARERLLRNPALHLLVSKPTLPPSPVSCQPRPQDQEGDHAGDHRQEQDVQGPEEASA